MQPSSVIVNVLLLVSDSHAVACCKISVHKFLLGQILHSRGNLQPEANQVLHSRVLNQSKRDYKNAGLKQLARLR